MIYIWMHYKVIIPINKYIAFFRETFLFKTQQADGILGLGVNSNTTKGIPNLIDESFAQH